MRNKKHLVMIMVVVMAASLLGSTAFAATADGSIVTANVNVRSGPATSYDKLGKMTKNQSVAVAAVNEAWAQIEYNGGKGFISRDYVKLYKDAGQYAMIEGETTAVVNLRSKATVGSEKITTLEKGDPLKVFNVSGNWAKVDWQGKAAYVNTKYITFGAATGNAQADAAPVGSANGSDYDWKQRRDYKVGKKMGVEAYAPDNDRTIATADCTVYAGPGTSFKQIGQKKKDAKMTVIAIFGDWMQIIYGEGFGFVPADAIRLYHPRGNYRSIEGVFAAAGKAYDKPSASGKVLHEANRGDSGVVIELKDGWAKFIFGNGFAYTQIKNLSFSEKIY